MQHECKYSKSCRWWLMIDWLMIDGIGVTNVNSIVLFIFFLSACRVLLSVFNFFSTHIYTRNCILSCTVTESPSCLRFLFHLRATLSSPPFRWSFFNWEKYKSRRVQEQEARLMSLSSPGTLSSSRVKIIRLLKEVKGRRRKFDVTLDTVFSFSYHLFLSFSHVVDNLFLSMY